MNNFFNVAKYKLKDGKGKPLNSFTLRELNGENELDAVARVVGANSKASSASLLSLTNQLIADAFVAVNGFPVVAPFVDWQEWPLRSRDFVKKAFERMNEASKDELDGFLEAAFGQATSERGELPSSENGSGSPTT